MAGSDERHEARWGRFMTISAEQLSQVVASSGHLKRNPAWPAGFTRQGILRSRAGRPLRIRTSSGTMSSGKWRLFQRTAGKNKFSRNKELVRDGVSLAVGCLKLLSETAGLLNPMSWKPWRLSLLAELVSVVPQLLQNVALSGLSPKAGGRLCREGLENAMCQ